MPALTIDYEKLSNSNTFNDLQNLARDEHNEMMGNLHAFDPDWFSLQVHNINGTFQILVARVDGEAVGYYAWMMDFDLLVQGTLIANMTAYYAKPAYPIAGLKLLDRAIAEYKRLGIKFAYFNHPPIGRGKKLGRLFERKGAELSQVVYRLDMR